MSDALKPTSTLQLATRYRVLTHLLTHSVTHSVCTYR